MPSPGITNLVPSWYSVRDYGATGATDQDASVAFQAAMIAASNNGGGLVLVPAGLYRLDSAISWSSPAISNVTLWLGNGATLSGTGATITASGTGNAVQDGRSGAVPVLTSTTNTFTALQTFSAGATVSGAVLTASAGATVSGAVLTASAGIANGSTEDYTQIASPAAPAAGVTRVYAKADGTMYYRTSTIGETPLGGGGFAKTFMLMGA
jgi:polygalacturonase